MTGEPILGIDLGTTNSTFAVMKNGRPTIVANAEGKRTTPSVVSFCEEDPLAGTPALNRIVQHPGRTVHSFLPHLGDEGNTVTIGGIEYTAAHVTAVLLEKIKHDAQAALGEGIERAVLAVPSRFSKRQRQAIKDAAEIAGLEVERFVSDSTAAAMLYGFEDKSKQTVLTYDLGGGTFDVSILELGGGVYEVVAMTGDADLGGDDWDQAIVDWLADDFEDEHGIDLRKDPQAATRLKTAAAEAKIDLSSRTETEIDLPFIATTDDAQLHLEKSLTRTKFELLTEHLVERTVELIERVLDESGYGMADIDDVLLVGGSTRMPQIREVIRELTGTDPSQHVNPDEAVALGAALQSGVLEGKLPEIVLLDALANSIGIETSDGRYEPLVEQNTTIPTEKSTFFTTTRDDQQSVGIRVFEGESERAEANEEVCELELTDISPGPAGTPQIDVTLSIDTNGCVNVSVEDNDTGACVERAVDHHPQRLTAPAKVWGEIAALGHRPAGIPWLEESDDWTRTIEANRPDRMREYLPSIADDVPAPERLDTTSVALGIETAGGLFERLIEKNTTVPSSKRTTFTTAVDDQRSVPIRVVQGEREFTADNELLKEFQLSELPPAEAGASEIEVIFSIDEDWELTVTAAERTCDVEKKITIEGDDLYSGKRIAQMQREGKEHATADRNRRLQRERLIESETGVDPSGLLPTNDGKWIAAGDSDSPSSVSAIDRIERQPTEKEITSLLAVRDNLARATETLVEDPAPVQTGLEATGKKIDQLRQGSLTSRIADHVIAAADDVDRAVETDPSDQTDLRRWIDIARMRVDHALEAADVTVIDPEPGTAVDPDRHEVADRTTADVPANTIVSVARSGYERDGSIGRPARVTVCELAQDTAGATGATRTRIPDSIPKAPSLGGLSFGDLELGERIGHGGNADVYEATVECSDERHTLALKQPRIDGTVNVDTLEQFNTEVEVWSKLDNGEFIVDVVDWGVEPVPWLAIEYMDGGVLSAHIESMSYEQSLWTALQVANGLFHAHSNGVAHLDLKPTNILLREVDGRWNVPKLGDWGLAKFMLNHSKSVDGYSPRYAAPEQLDETFGTPDQLTDVYGFGAICYELFTGEPPFEGPMGRVVTQVLSEEPTPPGEIADIPVALDSIITTAMAKEKDDRYDAIVLVRERLRELFENRQE